MVKNSQQGNLEKRMEELRDFLQNAEQEPVEYEVQLVRRLIEKIIVKEEGFVVKFWSGIEVEV